MDRSNPMEGWPGYANSLQESHELDGQRPQACIGNLSSRGEGKTGGLWSIIHQHIVKVIDKVKRQRIKEDIMKRLDMLENDFLPQVMKLIVLLLPTHGLVSGHGGQDWYNIWWCSFHRASRSYLGHCQHWSGRAALYERKRPWPRVSVRFCTIFSA